MRAQRLGERAVRRTIGTIDIDGRASEVVAVFPDAYDLAASKIAIGRAQDAEFVAGSFSAGGSTGVAWRTDVRAVGSDYVAAGTRWAG